MTKMEDIRKAADTADWRQIILNGGPPCFHLDHDGAFCLRAKRWVGHGPAHKFISLRDLIDSLANTEREAMETIAELSAELAHWKEINRNFVQEANALVTENAEL